MQIAPTRDEREIRRAYARILKSREHESDAIRFEILRNAYEQALQLCRENAEPVDEVGTLPDPGVEPSVPDSAVLIASPDAPSTAELNRHFGIAHDENPEDVIRAGLDALRAALERHESGLDHWQTLQDYPPLASLMYRDDVSPYVADMIATHWPYSNQVWLLARDFFRWEIPTSHDRSALAHALRWLFASDERAIHQWQPRARHVLSETEQQDKEWRDFVQVCSTLDPDPFRVLEANRIHRAWRYFFEDGSRLIMRHFLASLDELGAHERIAQQESLSWWREALARPRITAWAPAAGALVTLLCLFMQMPLVYVVLVGICITPVIQYGLLQPLHHWATRTHARVIDSRWRRIGGMAVFAAGCLTSELTAYGTGSLETLVPVLLLTIGTVWTLLACYPAIVRQPPTGLARLGRVLWLAINWAAFAFLLGSPVAHSGVTVAGGAMLALWVACIDRHAWSLLRQEAGDLAGRLSPLPVLALSIVLLAADALFVGKSPELGVLFLPLSVLTVCFGWSYARETGWRYTGGVVRSLILLAIMNGILAVMRGLFGRTMLIEEGATALFFLVPLLAIIAWQCFKVQRGSAGYSMAD